MPGIDTVVTYLFEMFFRDMLDEAFDESKDGDGLCNQFIILMAVIVKGDHVTIIFINAGGGDNRPSKVSADVFGDDPGIALIGFGVDIEPVFVVPVDGGFELFKTRVELRLEFIKKGSLKSIAQETVIEMSLGAPSSTVTDTTLGEKAVDMWVPFKVASKGMEDTDKTGSKAFGTVIFMEHTKDDTADGREETAQQGAVSEEEGAEFFCDGEDTVTVFDIQDLKGHGSGTINRVFDAAGGAETAVAAERDKFKFPAFITAIHGTAKRRITAVKHPVNIPDDRLPRMENIKHFFIMVIKDVLKDVHKTIMRDLMTENNPTPQD